MCDHTKLNYECGHSVYRVKAWCVKYQDTHVPCGSNPIEMLVFTTLIMRKHSVADMILVERSS